MLDTDSHEDRPWWLSQLSLGGAEIPAFLTTHREQSSLDFVEATPYWTCVQSVTPLLCCQDALQMGGYNPSTAARPTALTQPAGTCSPGQPLPSRGTMLRFLGSVPSSHGDHELSSNSPCTCFPNVLMSPSCIPFLLLGTTSPQNTNPQVLASGSAFEGPKREQTANVKLALGHWGPSGQDKPS